MPQISIIIPVYNVGEYLGDCVDSVISQNFDDLEIICINDGSTDHSLAILEGYQKRDNRITVISQKNQGLSATRNQGLKYAAGKYICFVDSDDMLAPGALKSVYNVAEKDELQMVSYDADVVYENEKLKEHENKDSYFEKSKLYTDIKDGKSYFVEMMEKNDYCDSACLLFLNRDWLITHGITFYPGICYEDVLFTLQCFWKTKRMRHINKKSYIYRVRSLSIMTSKPSYINVYSCLINYKEAMKLLLDIDIREQRLQEMLAKYMKSIVSRIRYLDHYIEKEHVEMDISPIDSLLESSLEVGEEKLDISMQILLAGLEKVVHDSCGVILYGAGKIGKMVQGYLHHKNLDAKILCFAVSKIASESTEINGIPTIDIHAVKDSDYLILLSAERKFQLEMKEELKKLNLNNYVCIDRYMVQMLAEYLEKIKKEK